MYTSIKCVNKSVSTYLSSTERSPCLNFLFDWLVEHGWHACYFACLQGQSAYPAPPQPPPHLSGYQGGSSQGGQQPYMGRPSPSPPSSSQVYHTHLHLSSFAPFLMHACIQSLPTHFCVCLSGLGPRWVYVSTVNVYFC